MIRKSGVVLASAGAPIVVGLGLLLMSGCDSGEGASTLDASKAAERHERTNASMDYMREQMKSKPKSKSNMNTSGPSHGR